MAHAIYQTPIKTNSFCAHYKELLHKIKHQVMTLICG